MADTEWREELDQTPPEGVEDEPSDGQPEPEPEGETQEGQQAEEPSDGEQPDAGGAKSKGTAKLIRTLKRKVKEYELQTELLADQLKQYKAQLEQPEKPQPPNIEDFEDVEDFEKAVKAYGEAVARYERERSAQPEEPEEVAHARQQAMLQAIEANWQEQVKEAAQRYPDFGEKVMADDLPINEVMALTIKQLPDGADVAYWLANNPDVTREIAQLDNPLDVQRAIVWVESQVSGPPIELPRKEKVSAPGVPVIDKAGTTGRASRDPEKMSTDQWMKMRWEQRLKR